MQTYAGCTGNAAMSQVSGCTVEGQGFVFHAVLLTFQVPVTKDIQVPRNQAPTDSPPAEVWSVAPYCLERG